MATELTSVPTLLKGEPINQAAKAVTELQPLESAQLKFRQLDAMGKATEYLVEMPKSDNFAELSFPQKLWLLKVGPCSKFSMETIAGLVIYAKQLSDRTHADIDVMQMDVYPTGEGRIGVSNTARWKIAKATGRIEGYKAEFKDLGTTFTVTDKSGEHEIDDFACTVTIHVKGFKEPVVKTQHLSEWYIATSPVWRNKPMHMLEQNTRGHACEVISPTDGADFSEPDAPKLEGDVVKAAAEATLAMK